MVEASRTRSLAKLDIIQFARDALSEVDGVRAYRLAFDNEAKTGSEQPVESRVNAFFRLLGLPMFVSLEPLKQDGKTSKSQKGQLVLTPGFHEGEQIQQTLYRVRDSKDVKLEDPAGTGTQIPVSTLVATRREQVLKERESRIGTELYNNAMIRAMYRVEVPQLYARRTIFPGYDYVRAVAPFVTSYIDVQPHSRELAKPFVTDPKDAEVDGQRMKKPFIETVLRIRLSTTTGADQTQEDYMDALRTALEDVSRQAFGSDSPIASDALPELLPAEASLLESFIISQMLAAIDQLAQRWVLLQRERERIVKKAEIALVPKTASARQSVFGRQSNTSLTLQVTPESELGRQRVKLQQRIAVSSALIGLVPTEDSLRMTTSAQFSPEQNVSSSALTRPFLSLLRQDLDQERSRLEEVERRIQEESRRANQLRLEIEAMTGEFTGLSVVDVVFTIMALFLIDRRHLIGLLDAPSQVLMKQEPTLQKAADAAGAASAVESVAEVAAKVGTLYDLLAAAIEYTYDRKKRSNINRQPKASQQISRTTSQQERAESMTEGASS
jgi:hypothetical protein